MIYIGKNYGNIPKWLNVLNKFTALELWFTMGKLWYYKKTMVLWKKTMVLWKNYDTITKSMELWFIMGYYTNFCCWEIPSLILERWFFSMLLMNFWYSTIIYPFKSGSLYKQTDIPYTRMLDVNLPGVYW